MEQTPQTSFIPKQGGGPAFASSRQKRSFNILTFFSTIIFLITLIATGGIFFYKKTSEDILAAKKKELSDFRGKIPPSQIEEIKEFDQKISTARALLDQHLSLTRLFDALERRTQEKVQFTSFDFKREKGAEALVALEGAGESFNTLVLQEREFLNERAFEDGTLIFSDINVVAEENDAAKKKVPQVDQKVTFKVSADLNTEAVRYEGQALERATTTTTTPSLPSVSSTSTASSSTP